MHSVFLSWPTEPFSHKASHTQGQHTDGRKNVVDTNVDNSNKVFTAGNTATGTEAFRTHLLACLHFRPWLEDKGTMNKCNKTQVAERKKE